jgi:Putative phage metallopeptidase
MSTLNITAALERLILDAVSRLEEFQHIQPERLLVCLSSTRSGGIHGTYAKIHPLRFANGAVSTEIRRGRRRYLCTMPTVTHNQQDILYLLYFLVPRFLNLSLREKLVTVFHELYHIAPAFDGDIRRFPGRNFAHGSSKKVYNQRIGLLVDAYLERLDNQELLSALSGTMLELRARHRTLVGRRFPAPKLQLTPVN